MENRRQKGESAPPDPSPQTHKTRMVKPPIRTTEYGTRYVRVTDIIHSEEGWNEIDRLMKANLVQKPSTQQGESGQPPTKDADAG